MSSGVSTVTAVVVRLALSVLAFGTSVFLVRKRWRFTDTPTSDAAHVFPGLTEVHGVVEAIGAPIKAPTDGGDCVWWMYEVQRWQRSNKNGRWITEEKGVTALPFDVRDASGTVRVVLDEQSRVSGADKRDVEHLPLAALRPAAQVMHKTYDPVALFGGLFGSNEPSEPIAAFRGRWRAYEYRLRVGDPVFITADAQLTVARSGVELRRTTADGDKCLFEVSVGDEQAARSRFAPSWLLVLTMLATLGLAAFAGNEISPAMAAVLPLAFFGAAVLAWCVGTYNRLRRARERCDFAWSLIDVSCEQRATTIPQLQSVVGAALVHERATLEMVAAARTIGHHPSAAGARTVEAAEAASAQLVVLIESLPELKTQANVAQLMEQITLLTDRVAFGRRFYNDSVQRLADRVGQFPDSLFAKVAGVRSLPLIGDLGAPDSPPALDL